MALCEKCESQLESIKFIGFREQGRKYKSAQGSIYLPQSEDPEFFAELSDGSSGKFRGHSFLFSRGPFIFSLNCLPRPNATLG